MKYVAKDTNYVGGQRFEVVAEKIGDEWHFSPVGAEINEQKTIMDDETFQDIYELASIEPKKRVESATPAPPHNQD